MEALAPYGTPEVDGAGNIILSLAGPDGGGEGKVALLAHKDEIGGLVKRVEEGGRLIAQTLGDAHPWIWGEGPVEVLGRHDTVLGVLSFGSRHVSDESPQRKQLDDTPVKWKDAWIETKLSAEALEAAGVTVGIARRARALAQAAGAAGRRRRVRGLSRARRQGRRCDAARAGRPAGCSRPPARPGVHDPRGGRLPGLPVLRRAAPTPSRSWRWRWCRWPRSMRSSPAPTLSSSAPTRYAPLDEGLSWELADAAAAAGVTVRHAAVTRYGSDASSSLDSGRVPRSACLAAATENTHGFEIAHLDAIDGCVRILHNWLG